MRHAGRHTQGVHTSIVSEDRPAPITGAGRPALGVSLRRRLLGISLAETSVARRGFVVHDPRVGARLEAIGAAFIGGYHLALECRDELELGARLDGVEAERRGFAFEGAAMGLLLLDALTPWARGRWLRFANGPGERHLYMVHVGAGWALARLPGGFRRAWLPFHPLLRWLAYDGYGFHEGYFHRERRVLGREVPEPLSGYALRAFDQGLGRSLWFGEGADPTRIAAAIAAVAPARRADLWSGVGLAAAYAGAVEAATLESLPRLAREYAPHLRQGAAFAAKARERAGNPAAHTSLACRVLCGMEAEAAALVTDEALESLPADGETPAFEVWRTRVRERFARMERGAGAAAGRPPTAMPTTAVTVVPDPAGPARAAPDPVPTAAGPARTESN